MATVLGFPISSAVAEEGKDLIDIYVLVDESASLSSQDVALEREALKRLLALNDVRNADDSRVDVQVGILPFSSGANAPRQDPLCALASVSENLDSLYSCIDRIDRRQAAGLDDTDFASAIQTALTLFNRPSASKVLILMTDGRYDPDGNKSLSPDEEADLDAALANAVNNRVSIWPLGFGDADEVALSEYAARAYQGDERCSVAPKSSLGKNTDLATKIQTIIANSTCTGEFTCNLQPDDLQPDCTFKVNPLLNEITIEIYDRVFGREVESGQISVTKPDGERVCDSALLSNRIWVCTEKIDGQDGGIWKADSTIGGFTARVTTSGLINLAVIDCEADQVPQLKISRSDGAPVDYDANGASDQLLWPFVSVGNADLREQDYLASQELTSVEFYDDIPLGTELRAYLVRDPKILNKKGVEQLVIRVDRTESCTIVEPGAVSTTSSVPPSTPNTSTPASTAAPPCESDCGPPQFPWIIVVIAVALIAGAIGLFVYLRSKRFPAGVELTVRNGINSGVFDFVEGIGGQAKIYFDAVTQVGSATPEIVIGSKGSGSRYVLTRYDSEQIQIRSTYEANQHEDESEGDQSILEETDAPMEAMPLIVLNEDEFNVREADPDDAVDKSEPIYLRLSWPIDESDVEEID